MSLVSSGEDPAAYITEILAINEKLKKELKIAQNRIHELESVPFTAISKNKLNAISISRKPAPLPNACSDSFSGLSYKAKALI
jgi:hypothetical protein